MMSAARTRAWIMTAAIACYTASVPAQQPAVAQQPASAQQPVSAQQPAPVAPKPGCTDELHRQFDFWIGDWAVTVGGKPAGENRIEKVLAGCALLENWTGAGGMAGKSLNFYDPANKSWHQTWISDQGGALYLDGEFKQGTMVLEGEAKDPASGAVTRHRITWTPLPGGDVRQYWVSSTDGKEWTPQFDGLYKRKG